VRLSVGEAIDWIRGTAAPMAGAKNPQAGLGQVSAARTAEAPAPATTATNDDAQGAAAEQAAREGVQALLESAQAERLRLRLQNGSAADSDSSGASNDDDITSGDTTQRDPSRSDDTQSSFIVTGPLLDEYGTPAQIFHARRGYFTAMSWYLDRLNTMAANRAPIGVQSARTNVRRLQVLAPMLPEFFALDERTSTVPTRADRRIWDQPTEFERQASMFELSLSVLEASLASANIDEQGVRARIALVGRVCAGCHEKFRKQGEKDVGALTP
jgi:cytochrome c556